MKLLATAAALLSTTLAAISTKRAATVLIPKSVFDNTSALEQYFTYNYPWGGDTHNGTPSSSLLSYLHVLTMSSRRRPNDQSPGVYSHSRHSPDHRLPSLEPAPSHARRKADPNPLPLRCNRRKATLHHPSLRRLTLHRIIPRARRARNMACILADWCCRLASRD